MKIIISHVYSNDNKGDAALLSVLLSDIRRGFPGAVDNPQVTILTMDAIKKDETFDGVPVKNGFMHYANNAFGAFFLASSTLAWALVYRYTKKSLPLPGYLKDIVLLYRDADLIIPVGGGYIRSAAGFRNTVILFFILHPLWFSALIRKPTIGYTQSVGPFGNAFQEWMAKSAVKRMTGIIVRERISLALLEKWGITKNVFLSVDSGFSFVSDQEKGEQKDLRKDLYKELGIPAGQMIVGVTVRNWLKDKEQATYEKAVAKLCDHIVEKYNAAIVFIPQVTVENHHDDDRESSRRVFGFTEHKANAHVMVERYDHREIKAIYGALDYLVGTRFHSVIFALTSYVPAIAIGYEHKTLGIMTDLGLEKWVIDIREANAGGLIVLFDELVADRDGYVGRLKKVLPPYIKEAERSIGFVKEIYERI